MNRSPLLPERTGVGSVTEEVPMMWWGGYHYWGSGYHWWWAGLVVMAVFMVVCFAVMALMMGRGRMSTCMGGMFGSWRQHSGRHETDAPERILDERLARGEIDIEEYRRIQETLARPGAGRLAGDRWCGRCADCSQRVLAGYVRVHRGHLIRACHGRPPRHL